MIFAPPTAARTTRPGRKFNAILACTARRCHLGRVFPLLFPAPIFARVALYEYPVPEPAGILKVAPKRPTTRKSVNQNSTNFGVDRRPRMWHTRVGDGGASGCRNSARETPSSFKKCSYA